jgi:hypothetical protein
MFVSHIVETKKGTAQEYLKILLPDLPCYKMGILEGKTWKCHLVNYSYSSSGRMNASP